MPVRGGSIPIGVWGDILPTGMPQLFLPVKKYRQSLAYLIFLCGRMFGKLLQPEAIFLTENAQKHRDRVRSTVTAYSAASPDRLVRF